MIYFSPIPSDTIAGIKRFGRLSLMLPIFIIVAACDSASSNTAASGNRTQATSANSALNTAKALQDNDAKEASSDNEIDASDEGQSLIVATQSDDATLTRRTPMISDKRDGSSTLQATLMGDYGGMLPCSSCDSIDSTLNLFANGSVVKTSIYNNSETSKVPLVESGVYRQDGNTITIVYENKNIESYRIQDNHLIMMDEDKNLDADYTLWRK